MLRLGVIELLSVRTNRCVCFKMYITDTHVHSASAVGVTLANRVRYTTAGRFLVINGGVAHRVALTVAELPGSAIGKDER